MALNFSVKTVGKIIAVRFLKVWRSCQYARNCGANNSVPESAEEIGERKLQKHNQGSCFRSVEASTGSTSSDEPAQRCIYS